MQKQTKSELLGVSTVKMILAVSFIVSFGAIMVAAGYYLAKVTINEPIPYQSVSHTVVPSAIKDEIIEQKIYKNEDYGLEFSYPDNYCVQEGKNSDGKHLIEIASNCPIDHKIGVFVGFHGTATIIINSFTQ